MQHTDNDVQEVLGNSNKDFADRSVIEFYKATRNTPTKALVFLLSSLSSFKAKAGEITRIFYWKMDG